MPKPALKRVWALIITTGVDDYKPRGETARSEVKLYKSAKRCNEAFVDYIIDKVQNCETLPDELNVCDDYDEYLYDEDEDKESFPMYFIKGEHGLRRNEKIPKELLPVYRLAEYLAEGEFIPQKWTYEIKHLQIQG